MKCLVKILGDIVETWQDAALVQALKEHLEEKTDWWVSDCYVGPKSVPGWELGQGSPAGEDFSIVVEHRKRIGDAIESIRECADGFDADEHVAMWIEARRNGVSGVPSTQTLLNDAEAIQDMLRELVEDVDAWYEDVLEDVDIEVLLDDAAEKCSEVNKDSVSK